MDVIEGKGSYLDRATAVNCVIIVQYLQNGRSVCVGTLATVEGVG